MTSAQEGTSGVSRRVRKMDGSRRSWTPLEEEVLIASMKEVIVKGFKPDNGFRAGYLDRVEDTIKKVFPGTDLKGNPHINSKLTSWKKNYYSLTGILSRFDIGFNMKGNFMIDCEDEQCEQVVKADPNARKMRYKSWKYYDDWKILFGKDRANGEGAEDISDAYDALRDEDNTSNGGMCSDYNVSLEDLQESEGVGDSVSHSRKTRDVPNAKPKKQKMTTEVSRIKEALLEIGQKTDERLATLVEGIAYESELGKARKGTFQQLGDIPGSQRIS